MNVLKRLDRWIFGFGSATTLGVYRAIFGGLIFINLLMLSIDFQTWFTENGLVPLEAAKIWSTGSVRFGLLQNVTDSRVTLLVFALTTVAALLTTLGLFTRVATIILAVGLVSLHLRNPIILHGGDTLMRVTAIYFAIMPVGAAFSLDRLRAEKRAGPGGLPKAQISLWPQRLIQVQMALMYSTTVWHKCTGVLWLQGIAAWYPPKLTEFNRFPTPAFVDLPPFLQMATYGTLIVELALASLVFWKPARKWVLLSGILLHAVIEYRFNIPLFAFLSVAQYISHYESPEVEGWLARMKRRFSKEATPETT